MRHLHIGPIDIQLFGYQRRQGGLNALAHVGPRSDDRETLLVDHQVGGQRITLRHGSSAQATL